MQPVDMCLERRDINRASMGRTHRRPIRFGSLAVLEKDAAEANSNAQFLWREELFLQDVVPYLAPFRAIFFGV